MTDDEQTKEDAEMPPAERKSRVIKIVQEPSRDLESSETTNNSTLGEFEVTLIPKEDIKEKKANGSTFTKLILLSRNEWPALVLSFLLTIGNECGNIAPPIILVAAYNAVVNPNIQKDDMILRVQNTMVIVLLVHGGGMVCGFLKGAIQLTAGERVVSRLRSRLFQTILLQDIAFFDERKTGELTSRLGSDTTLVQMATTSGIPEVLSSLVKVIVSMVLMFTISAQLTGIVLGVAVVMMILAIPFGKFTSRLSKRYQDALAAAQSISTEALSAMKTVRAFGTEANELKRYANNIGDPFTTKCWFPRARDETTYHVGMLKAFATTSLLTFVFGFGIGAMYGTLWYGFYLVVEGILGFGELMAFQSYIWQIAFGIGSLASQMSSVMTAIGSSVRIFELLENIPSIPLSGGLVPEKPRGQVDFEQVSFRYPSRPKTLVLNNFTLRVPVNSTAALVGYVKSNATKTITKFTRFTYKDEWPLIAVLLGSSGSGKSTVAALLLRFYDVTSGCVRIDGHDVRELDQQWLHNNVAYVQQEPVLFGMSVRANVCYGVAGRVVSDEELVAACRKANAHGFIEALSEGYDTIVGERGVLLSGGQKQRLAIARALMMNPRILVLDEATSALDAESEFLVQEAINNLMVGRTTLLVAHRLSTVRRAQQIVVVHEGHIEDVGCHDDLMLRCTRYSELVKRQLDAD